MDLAGDGRKDVVLFTEYINGYYEYFEESWRDFKSFQSCPKINWNDPNLRFIDLNGDGHADILISEDDVFIWYPSCAKNGFRKSEIVNKFYDEEKSPSLLFADTEQSVPFCFPQARRHSPAATFPSSASPIHLAQE